MNKKIDQQAADNIRALAVAMVEKANSGHPRQLLSEFLAPKNL